jgi:hypothetical protein
MPRAQTGITPLLPKNVLILSFRVEDLPLKAMSIGHIAANIPGLVNEIRESASGSDLLYSIGFGTLLWNFIWQAQHPPGFRPLEFEDENEIEEEDEDETDGSDLTFCFFSSNPDLLDYLAEESQVHLKNIARVYDRVLANLVEEPKDNRPAGNEKNVVIGPEHPEFFQSSFLFTLGLAPAPQTNSKLSKADQESISQNLAKDFLSLTENETGLIHHLYACQTESERRHYLLALSNRVEPFQNILDAVVSSSDDFYKTPLGNMEITPTLHFLPSLEILAAFRMGTLRMGPLSPTAKWK